MTGRLEQVAVLAQALAEALPGDWSVGADKSDHADWWVDITRSDGLAVSLSWRGGERAYVSPVVPTMPGSYNQRSDLRMTFDPERPVQRVANEIQRRIVIPWQPELERIVKQNKATLDARNEAILRYEALAEAMHTKADKKVIDRLNEGEDGVITFGSYGNDGLRGTITVSTYRQRTRFEIDVHDQPLALALAESLGAFFAP